MKKSSLLIASSNQGKLLEIRAIVEQSQLILPFDLITPQELGLTLEVPETGSTYQENAAIKAVTYARHFGMITMADDSGLEVELLGGEPGVRSARYSPIPDATDADRRTYLLQRLVGHPQPWQARFYCLVAIATPERQVIYKDGECKGMIIPEERGENGFGYDPIFYLPQLGKTMAELETTLKNQLSHRGRAVSAALPVLIQIFA
jgi:XTP/dITP diphosphohydrolase